MSLTVTTTQQAYPWRAAARTAVQVLVALPTVLLVLAGLLTIVAQDAFAKYLPDGWVAWLVGASVFCAALSGLLSRLMAFPAVDAWLSRLRLSSAPTPAPTGPDGTPVITTLPAVPTQQSAPDEQPPSV